MDVALWRRGSWGSHVQRDPLVWPDQEENFKDLMANKGVEGKEGKKGSGGNHMAICKPAVGSRVTDTQTWAEWGPGSAEATEQAGAQWSECPAQILSRSRCSAIIY